MVKLYLNYFPNSKMAISEHENGHFEDIRGWLQILELVSNSTIFHLLFDTYDSPGAVFIWKWEKYRPYLLVCRNGKILNRPPEQHTLQRRHGEFEPGKDQYSIPIFLTSCFLYERIETQKLGNALALEALPGMAVLTLV